MLNSREQVHKPNKMHFNNNEYYIILFLNNNNNNNSNSITAAHYMYVEIAGL